MAKAAARSQINVRDEDLQRLKRLASQETRTIADQFCVVVREALLSRGLDVDVDRDHAAAADARSA